MQVLLCMQVRFFLFEPQMFSFHGEHVPLVILTIPEVLSSKLNLGNPRAKSDSFKQQYKLLRTNSALSVKWAYQQQPLPWFITPPNMVLKYCKGYLSSEKKYDRHVLVWTMFISDEPTTMCTLWVQYCGGFLVQQDIVDQLPSLVGLVVSKSACLLPTGRCCLGLGSIPGTEFQWQCGWCIWPCLQ